MYVVADVCVVPMGVGTSVSKEVAECQRIFKMFKLKTQLHAYGTNLEGEWSEVFSAIEACHRALHENGVPRLSTSIKVGTRQDKKSTIDDKVRAVETRLTDKA